MIDLIDRLMVEFIKTDPLTLNPTPARGVAVGIVLWAHASKREAGAGAVSFRRLTRVWTHPEPVGPLGLFAACLCPC